MKRLKDVFTLLAVLVLALGLAGPIASCGDGDDDDDDAARIPTEPVPETRATRTAYDDFSEADAWVAEGIYSNAMCLYEAAIEKLTDGDPANDGPDRDLVLDRSRYGAVLCMITLPLKILEGFIDSFMAGEDDAVSRFIIEDYQRRSGEQDVPTNLITLYIRDWLLPMVEQANDRLDALFENPDFFYEMPVIRLTLFQTAITIPDAANPDGRGRHDLVEASLLSALMHMVEWAFRSLLSYNINIDVVKIDEILWLIRQGDLSKIFGMLEEYPHLLEPSTPAANGIEGGAMLMAAYEDFAGMFLRMRDDDDRDGIWNPLIDSGELPDDLFDALASDGGEQVWDVLPRTEAGIGLNIRTNGMSLRGSLIEGVLNIVLTELMTDDTAAFLQTGFLGHDPPEPDPDNGYDDDFALGLSTVVEPGRLEDASASFAPHALTGRRLDPNVFQGLDDRRFETFLILDNSSTVLLVAGDPSAVASPGDLYAVGDGIVDDRIVPLSILMTLLGIGDWPASADFGLFYGAFFADLPNMREVVPAWDSEVGDPDFYGFVVDRTESFEDANVNGRYDPGVDLLHDADHVYGSFFFPADGRYQPYYAYFGDPTWGNILRYDERFEPEDYNNLTNLLISKLAELMIAKEGGLQ